VEAVSHSPYWDDTAIFILEDDARTAPITSTLTARLLW